MQRENYMNSLKIKLEKIIKYISVSIIIQGNFHWSGYVTNDILSHFFDGLNCGSSVWKPKHNGLLRKKNTKGLILKQKGTRMAEDGEDWNGLEMTMLKCIANFSKYTNNDVPGNSFKMKYMSISQHKRVFYLRRVSRVSLQAQID